MTQVKNYSAKILIERIKIHDEINQKANNILESQSYGLLKLLFSANSSLSVYLENDRRFYKALEKVNNIELHKLTTKERMSIQIEFATDVFNLLNAAFSLKDHLKRILKGCVSNTSISLFFRFLRNYLVHIGTLRFTSQFVLKHGAANQHLQLLERDSFLEYLNDRLKDTMNKENANSDVENLKRTIAFIKERQRLDLVELYDGFKGYIISVYETNINFFISKEDARNKLESLLEEVNEYDKLVSEFISFEKQSTSGTNYIPSVTTILTEIHKELLIKTLGHLR